MISEEGSGWRLAWDPSRKKFPVLVGGQGWAFELTDSEWRTFVHLVLDLINEYQQLKSQLMGEESICLEMERDFWWGSLEGDQSNWALQVILQNPEPNLRGIEGFWPVPIAKEFSTGLRTMWDSYQ